jgi:hypothetical protein
VLITTFKQAIKPAAIGTATVSIASLAQEES